MARLRAVVVVAVVLVLGAWTCQVPTDSPGSPGATVASGVTTTGLTSLLAGEDWHYVGEAGEPAFENGWANVSGEPKTAFRIRESGVVDIHLTVDSGTPGATIFTLPVGYRPSHNTHMQGTGYSSLSPVTPTSGGFGVLSDGRVIDGSAVSGILLTCADQFFLNPPELAP